MKTAKLTAVVSLAFIITACCACRRNASTVPLVNTPWKVAQLYGASVTGSNAESFTMTLYPEGKLSGQGDCNRYSGSYNLTATGTGASGKLSTGSDMITTRMMCRGQEQENKYLQMLREIDSYSIDGERLLLIKGGDVLAIFDRMPEPVVSTQPIDEPVIIRE